MTSGLISAEALTLHAQGRDHSGGSAPDLHGIPLAGTWCVFDYAGVIARDRGKVKM